MLESSPALAETIEDGTPAPIALASSSSSPAGKPTFSEAVLSYKYSSPNASLLETLFLRRYWNWAVTLFPMWMAPNVITVIGGSFCLALYHINWYSSPKGLGEGEPQLVYALFALLLFAYSTFDACDGIQARRTGSGSALGELMDHGVDAVITTMITYSVNDAMGLGIDRSVVWVSILGSLVAFYMSNLTLLHRGKQAFFPVDITELQFVLIAVFALSGLFGPRVWWETWFPIPFEFLTPALEFIANALDIADFISPTTGRFQARFIIALGAVGGMSQNVLLYTLMAAQPYVEEGKALPHPGCGVWQLVRHIAIIATFTLLCIFALVALASIPGESTRHYAYRAFLLLLSFAFGDLMDRLLVMRVSHLPFPTVSPTLVCVALFAGAAHFLSQQPAAVLLPALWSVALLALASHLAYFTWITRKLAAVLGIRVFTIKKQS